MAIPQQLNLQAFVTIGLQVLGISYNSLRPSLAKAVGEKELTRVEKIVSHTQSNSKIARTLQLLQKIINKGIVGAWEEVQNYFQGLNQQKEQIIKQIKDIAFKQIKAAIDRLINFLATKIKSFLNNTGKKQPTLTTDKPNNNKISGNGNRRKITVPEQSKKFEMYGKSHTLYMYLKNGECGVDIASRREYFENAINA